MIFRRTCHWLCLKRADSLVLQFFPWTRDRIPQELNWWCCFNLVDHSRTSWQQFYYKSAYGYDIGHDIGHDMSSPYVTYVITAQKFDNRINIWYTTETQIHTKAAMEASRLSPVRQGKGVHRLRAPFRIWIAENRSWAAGRKREPVGWAGVFPRYWDRAW